MELSARNQLKATVKEVTLGDVVAEVVLDVSGQTLVSTITRSSAERLALQPGDAVVAVVKASEVIIGK